MSVIATNGGGLLPDHSAKPMMNYSLQSTATPGYSRRQKGAAELSAHPWD
ncbi:hypothetical protein [Schleiferilactobacillus perolens]|nr:hypothetical protein [Schleiferilactobacillus perolens]MCI2170727.1 hypothetical protein [Schleiferilactobacillus perolens]